MAWIQVHQQLKDHRKLLAAADELEIDPPHMLGLVISFWLWALDNAPSGKLEGISNRMIARAAQWDGDPDMFVDAMTCAGLLDDEPPGTLEIHDWYEYAGKLIDQREAEKNRSRRRRAAAVADSSSDRRTTAGRPPDDQQTTGGRVDQSRVDKSRVDKKEDPPNNPPRGTGEGEEKPKTNKQEERFAIFWEVYPKKVGKKDALKKWNQLKPDAELFAHIMLAITAAKKSKEWTREGGRFVPNPSTWINQGRWDDELTPADNNNKANERRTSYGEHRQGSGNETKLSGFRMADD